MWVWSGGWSRGCGQVGGAMGVVRWVECECDQVGEVWVWSGGWSHGHDQVSRAMAWSGGRSCGCGQVDGVCMPVCTVISLENLQHAYVM